MNNHLKSGHTNLTRQIQKKKGGEKMLLLGLGGSVIGGYALGKIIEMLATLL